MQAVAVVRKVYKGDQVLVSLEYGNLRDSSSELYTQFIGMLLEDSEVIFNVNRQTSFKGSGIVTYSGIGVNLGNGMSASDGIFTAPVSGTYYFHFQGVAYISKGGSIFTYLTHNETRVACAFKKVSLFFCFIQFRSNFEHYEPSWYQCIFTGKRYIWYANNINCLSVKERRKSSGT